MLFIVLLLVYLWIIVPDSSTIENSGSKNVLLADDRVSIQVPEDWKIIPRQAHSGNQSRTPELQIVHNSVSGMVRLQSTKLPVFPIERLSKEKLRHSFGNDDPEQIKKNYGIGKFIYIVTNKDEFKPEKYISKDFDMKEKAESLEFDFKNGRAIGFSVFGGPKDSDNLAYLKVINFFIYDRMYTMRGIAKDNDRDQVDNVMEKLFKSIRWNEKEGEKSDS